MDRKRLARLIGYKNSKKTSKWGWGRNWAIIALFLVFVIVSIVKPQNEARYILHWGIWLPITTYVVLWECRRYLSIYKKALKGIFDMYTLIGLASHVMYAFCIVQIGLRWGADPGDAMMPWDAPGLLLSVALAGERIEQALKKETGTALKELHEMRKREVTVVINGMNVTKSASELAVGDVILVNKGQVVLADGIALQDISLDYTNITGEAKMQFAKKGSEVTSGALNIGEPALIEVKRPARESTIFKIVDSLLAASSAKPRLQRIADRLLQWFVLAVIAVALASFVVWLIIGLTVFPDLYWNAAIGGTIKVPADAWRVALEIGVTVLATSCPCALGIATPIISLITAQSLHKRGIIINNPKAIENISQVRYVAFDKTGTLTMPALKIDFHDATAELASVAKALESGVDHPIARAFKALPVSAIAAERVKNLDGLGVTGIVKGKRYSLQAAVLVDNPRPEATWIGLFEERKQVARFALVNELRPQTKAFVAWLHGQGIFTVMMTGDKREVACRVAKELGIKEVHYELGPAQKHELVTGLRSKGRTMFVGDGFNDSIATQGADISAAFSSGSDIVNTFADFSIVAEDFGAMQELFKITNKHIRNIKFSLAWAIAFNCLAIPVAVLGLIPPWAGAVLMIISNILVISNALLYKCQLMKKTKKTSKGAVEVDCNCRALCKEKKKITRAEKTQCDISCTFSCNTTGI